MHTPAFAKCYLVLISVLASTAFGQSALMVFDNVASPQRPAMGVFANLSLNQSVADFSSLPNAPTCYSTFQSGVGFGPSLGVWYELPIRNSIAFIVRLGYAQYGGTLTSDEHNPIYANGIEMPAVIEHSITAHLSVIAVQPMLSYQLTPQWMLRLGASLGFAVQSSFDQIETLKEPTWTGVFDNGLRTRNPQSGAIQDASKISATLIIGAGYSVPLNKANTIQAVPEFSINYGLTQVAKNISWSVNTYQVGVGIRYVLTEAATPLGPGSEVGR